LQLAPEFSLPLAPQKLHLNSFSCNESK